MVGDVCLLFVISTLAKLYMQITVLTYVAENEEQNKIVIFSKLASLLLSDKRLSKASAICNAYSLRTRFSMTARAHDRKNAYRRACQYHPMFYFSHSQSTSENFASVAT